MPLSEMYRTMLEANNPANWEKNRQSELMGQMLLQEKQQQLDESSRLRELFSRGGMPSEEAMFAASPATAMKYRESQNKQMKDFIEMQKSQQDIASSQFKLNAEQETLLGQAHGAVVDAFDQLISQGIPKDKAIEIVTPYAGQLTSHLATIGVRTGQSFDPKNINEDSIENMRLNARRSKYPLMSDKTLQEAQLRNIPPQMSPQQYYGEQHTTPEGYVTRTPGMGGQMPQSMPQRAPQPSMGQEDITEPQLQAYIASLPEGSEKQRLMNVISRGQSMEPGATSAVEVTPEELAKIRKFNEADKASAVETARETAKAEVARGEEGKRITDAFKRAIGTGGVSRVMKLISESTSGPTEAMGASVAARIPQPGGSRATPGMENIGSLNTVAGELRKTIERSPGPQSDKDVALAALDAADISNPNIPYNQRMKGFLEFTRIIKERADALGVDPKEIGIDVDIETGKKLSQGHKEDGYTFKGGDPSDPKNWEKD
jgi:hypothetical protein